MLLLPKHTYFVRNVLAGGERGVKSHISYKPYGEILRTDSYGPDITKFKYTGQEEDAETGLYYYKARYYDPRIGRFGSNDSMVFPTKAQGLNRMMYVEGNPVRYTDKYGHARGIPNFSKLFKHLIGGFKIVDKAFRSFARGIDIRIKNFAASRIGKNITYSLRKIGRNIDQGFRRIAKAIDGGFRWITSGGNYSRSNGNDLDAIFANLGMNTGGMFATIMSAADYNVTQFWQYLVKDVNWSKVILGVHLLVAGGFIMVASAGFAGTIWGIPTSTIVFGAGMATATAGIENILTGFTGEVPDKEGQFTGADIG